MNNLLSVHWALVSALWYFVNGILHTSAVINQHKGAYDRELLRLLMDGYVLLLSGALVFVCWQMMNKNIIYGGVIGIIVAGFMLVYCGMIFPFLKSFGTMAISIVLILVCIKAITSAQGI